jgi:Icc protein
MSNRISRRTFLKAAGAAAAAATAPFSLVEVVFGKGQSERFTFAYISDSHITHIKGTQFTQNFDKGLQRAVAEVNFMGCGSFGTSQPTLSGRLLEREALIA